MPSVPIANEVYSDIAGRQAGSRIKNHSNSLMHCKEASDTPVLMGADLASFGRRYLNITTSYISKALMPNWCWTHCSKFVSVATVLQPIFALSGHHSFIQPFMRKRLQMVGVYGARKAKQTLRIFEATPTSSASVWLCVCVVVACRWCDTWHVTLDLASFKDNALIALNIDEYPAVAATGGLA